MTRTLVGLKHMSTKPILDLCKSNGSPMDDWADMVIRAEAEFDPVTRLFRKALVKAALRATHGSQTKAAILLGVHRNTISRILQGDS